MSIDYGECRVHIGVSAYGPHELCRPCEQRLDKANRRHGQGKDPTKTQSETLVCMGRPLAVSLGRWPELPALIERARQKYGDIEPKPPKQATYTPPKAPSGEVVSLPTQQAGRPDDLAARIARLRAELEVAELAQGLGRDSYREALVSQMSRVVTQGVEGAAAEQVEAVVRQELSAALEAVSGRLTAMALVQTEGRAAK